MSHTPGPWKASGPNALGFRQIFAPEIAYLNGRLVAVVNDCGGIRQLPREQVDANCLLIAAAPDLLEACKTLLHYIEHGESGPFGFTVVFPPDAEPFAVRAAIAKATGEDSV